MPGSPRSIPESVQVNGIKEAIRKKILARQAEYERVNQVRTLQERLERFVMEQIVIPMPGVRNWKANGGRQPLGSKLLEEAPANTDPSGIDNPEAAEIRELAADADVSPEVLGGIISVMSKWLFDGTDALLEQIETEERAQAAGKIDKKSLDSKLVDRAFRFPAQKFIAGDQLRDVFNNRFVQELINEMGIEITIAHEIEATFDTEEAEENRDSFEECIEFLGDLEEKDPENPKMKFMSMKLSALGLYDEDPEKNPDVLNRPRKSKVKEYMLGLLAKAKEKNVFIRIDMEYFIHKDVTFEIFTEILDEHPEYADHLGMVFQAFLKDSPQDAIEIIAWARRFYERTGKRVSLRLVKGANIKPDKRQAEAGLHTQIADRTWHGKQRTARLDSGPDHWEPGITPVAKDSETTQRQFIEINKLFEQNNDCLDLAYGTHNPDTQAHVIQTWLNTGQPPSMRQLQSLFGMYNSRRWALNSLGVKQRAYIPYGLLDKILAYMTRRFKELQDADGGNDMPVMNYVTESHEGEQGRLQKIA
ncbi:MAG: proline dehydrogenase family protein [Candidatus Peregrinibacteria bacterium]|nr:proline dehydrogenase family protein [Candidatus Peregrinibacteria bacterium]